MPNWTYNNYRVYPTKENDEKSKKQWKDFRKKMFVKEDKEEHFDFNKIIPMPKELNITEGTQTKEEKKQAKENLKKHGHSTWYNWCCDKWGTKWNACHTDISDDENFYMEFRFDTAWSPPSPVIKALVKKYKLLTFSGDIEEESNAFKGVMGGKHGEYEERFMEPIH